MKKFFLSFICALVSLSAMAAFEKDGFWYYINGSGAVVTYAHDAQEEPIAGYYKGDVVIPDSVEYYGTKYAVRTIGIKAFCNCPDMTSLTIPATVETIEGDSTTFQGTPITSLTIKDSSKPLSIECDINKQTGDPFMTLASSLRHIYQGRNVQYYYYDPEIPRTILRNFTALESIVFGENVNNIQDMLYSGCTALKHIECRSTTPPYVWSALTDIDYENIELLVPKYYSYTYQNAAFWGKFTNIVEPEYPKQLEWRNMLPVNGEYKYYVTTDMALQALATLGAANDSVQAQFGYYRDKFNAKVSYRHGKEQDMETETLLANYPNTIWRVQQNVSWALSETDTAYVIELAYQTDQWLSYYNAEATGYLGWANYPYEPQTLSNLLDLDVTIISTNPDVATVDNKGVVTILNVGTTTIRATYTPAEGEAVSAEYTLTIENGNHFDIKFMGDIDTENYRTTYIEVNENNAADIFGDGKVSFDYDKGILTFSNYRRRLTDAENGVLGWSDWMDYNTHVPLIVEIEGTCSFTNNSAGIGSTGPLIIRGKGDNAKLILEGRFPQLMGSNITISHVDVHLVEETPHPVLTSDTLRVVDNAYLEIYGGREGDMYTWENEGDWVESGGLVAQFNDLQMGEGIGIITPGVIIGSEEDSEIGRREEGMKTFFVGGHEAMHIEIGPQPIVTPPSSGTVSMAALELTDDPKGTEIDGIRYTITANDSIDVTEGCLVLGSTMTETQMEKVIEMLIPGTAEFADKFHGISFFLPAGEGEIILTTQTFGTHELNIKVGTNAAAAFTQTDKGEVKMQYNCAEPTMVYIYGTQSSSPEANQSPRYVPIRFARAEEDDSDEATGSVKIYAMCITGEITALEDILGARSSSSAIKVLRNGEVFIIRDGKIFNLFGTELN